MTASAQGIDISSFQSPATQALLRGLAFAFAKATDGLFPEDGNFAANWAAIRDAGIHRGAYHELWSAQDAPVAAQAAHFLAAVRGRGLEPGDMLAVVASDYRGVSDGEVRAFCDIVSAATAGSSPVLVYSDLSVAATLTSCTGYDLWAAWPSDMAPASVTPWQAWRLWQWGQMNGIDADAFNGTAAEMDAWIAAYTGGAGQTWTEFDMAKLPVLREGDADEAGAFWFVRRLQDLVALTGRLNGISDAAGLAVDGNFGPLTGQAVRGVQAHYKITADGIAGAQTWSVLLTGSPS